MSAYSFLDCVKDQALMDYEKPTNKNESVKKTSKRLLDREKKKADVSKKTPLKPTVPPDREK